MANLENYTIIKNLGAGAFGQVKLARHKLTNTQVAIKVIKKKIAVKQGLLKNVKHEASFLHKFSHPNIIKLYSLHRFEYIKTENVHYLILEYVSGGELYSLLEKRGKLTENEAKKFFYQILSAIKYSHNHGVAHRDIKPENILLDEFKNIKLGDFGLSGKMVDGDFMKTPCGSANYAAPEILSGFKYAGTEVDVWSLGVLLYTLLAGSLPFDEASMPHLISKIKSAEYRIPYHFSPLAADLIEKMIVVNPLLRISVSDIFHHKWISESFPIQPITTSKPFQIDEEIFAYLISLPQFNHSNIEERKEKIFEKESYDAFTVSYDMLLYSKLKTYSNCLLQNKVFKEIRLKHNLESAPSDWNFCIKGVGGQESVIKKLCQSLKQTNCYWKFMTPFYLKVINRGNKKGLDLKFEARVYEVRFR